MKIKIPKTAQVVSEATIPPPEDTPDGSLELEVLLPQCQPLLLNPMNQQSRGFSWFCIGHLTNIKSFRD